MEGESLENGKGTNLVTCRRLNGLEGKRGNGGSLPNFSVKNTTLGVISDLSQEATTIFRLVTLT